MKALIICPDQRPALKAVSDSLPLVNLSLFGLSLLDHWLEHLARAGATHVQIVAGAESPEIMAEAGTGSRWGIKLELLSQPCELTLKEARLLYHSRAADWLQPPNDIVLAECFPGQLQVRLFESYAQFFSGLQCWLPKAAVRGRVGQREIQPGVWAGLRTRIAPCAKLVPPLWLGQDVRVGKETMLGPNAIIEDQVLVERGAEISNSFVGKNTCVGSATRLIDSLALGSTLVHWRRNFVTTIADPFLLCPLQQPSLSHRLGRIIGWIAARSVTPTPPVLAEKPIALRRAAEQ